MTPEERTEHLYADLITEVRAIQLRLLAVSIREAVLAEREACAQVADAYTSSAFAEGGECAEQIAAEIRARGKP